MLFKRQQIWQKLMQGVKELNKEVGEAVYVLIVDNIMIASTRKLDINDYLADEKAIVPDFVYAKKSGGDPYITEMELIYGMVLNILELPMELPKELDNLDIWVIKENDRKALLGSVEYEAFESIEEAANMIENLLQEDSTLTIENFAVIVGKEADIILQVGSTPGDVNARELKVVLL